ncbi:MAG: hypothetical protein ORN54_02860 [Cyclobacteriaceae bacterium]|nr:hypothetical protein [Cyclobacteriaceae bacterium]
MRNFLYLLFTIGLLTSCSKTEKDFVGEYQTLYTTKIEIANQFDPFMSFYSNKKREITAKTYYDLADIKLNLFIDESEKRLKGELRMTRKNEEGFLKTSVSVKDIDFDVSNLRIVNDTLIFSLDNQILKFEGKKINGRLIKNNKEFILGFEKGLTGSNNYTEKNPLYSSTRNEIIYNRTLSSDINRDSVFKQFYRLQITDFGQKREDSKKEVDKKILENSIKELEKRLE